MAPLPIQGRLRQLIGSEVKSVATKTQGVTMGAWCCDACAQGHCAISEPNTSMINLDALESDPAPIFAIKVGSSALAFELVFCNEAFRRDGFRDLVLAEDRGALLFRSWAQATTKFVRTYELGGRVWAAETAGTARNWKIVRATGFARTDLRDEERVEKCQEEAGEAIGARRKSIIIHAEGTGPQKSAVNLLPFALEASHLSARLETLQKMMEMSEVGVFEYTPSGKLIHANDAWYRLSSHPKNLPAHTEFSFMDLVEPDDQPLAMSMWNMLVEGRSVTFEMRWKPQPGSGDSAQWVLSACVPVFDDNGNLVSIAGNTVDINGQKKAQEAAVARVEALEQAALSERKFMRFAHFAPIAIYIVMPDQGIQYVNDQFFELTGHPHVAFNELDWHNLVYKEDTDKVESMLLNMLQGKKTEHLQFRLRRTWVNQEGIRSEVWVEASSYPELEGDGSVRSIMGTLFDISQFKWAESVAKRRIEEALEAKRQQENFIDMTSHELRNPLSAVIQCADSVISSLYHFTNQQLTGIQPQLEKFHEEISACIGAIQTIVSCSMHQKRIIDDVLTLSKLDSTLILITPMRVQPAVVVSDALKMFDVECHQMGISLIFNEDESLQGLDWVMLDSSRLLQVLINLLTNAIKFTKDRPTRKITVTLGGSWARPPNEGWNSVAFKNGVPAVTNFLDKPGWGDGAEAYIWLTVEDTGCGMTNEEQKKLFSRFSQATPRTHIKYGGAIGVHSKADFGSKFAFYVSTRVAQPPGGVAVSRARPPIGYRKLSINEAMMDAHINVLLVEDNLVNQKVLAKQLRKAGCNVNVAGNGVEALEWLKESTYWRGNDTHSKAKENITGLKLAARNGDEGANGGERREIDIILLDIEMPVMDGLTCARLIRDYEHQGLLAPYSNGPDGVGPTDSTTKQRQRLPILAVSANARSEQIEQALEAGMDDAIAKPFRIPELWPKMEGLILRLRNRVVAAKVP